MKTALIIEDNEDNWVLLSFILEHAGYKAIVATTGQEGYEMALAQVPDFILLDIQLPDINGTDVLRMLRASEVSKNIPVIAVTSFAMAGDRERLLEAGCDGYIEKPVDPEKVVRQIQEVIDG